MKSYAININQGVDANGDYVIRFEPTELKLNNFTWNVDTSSELNHSITYRKKREIFSLKSYDCILRESELFVKEATLKMQKISPADIDVKNVEISKIIDLLPEPKRKS